MLIFTVLFVRERSRGNFPVAPPSSEPVSGAVQKTEKNPLFSSAKEAVPELASLESVFNFGQSTFYPITSNAAPEVDAQSSLIADLESGETYSGVYPDKRWPLASITKLMTAVVAIKRIAPEEVVTLRESDFSSEVNHAVLNPQERYSVRDLVRVMLVASSNEAAEALAGYYGYRRFVEEMNNQAGEWDLKETFFDEPTGLSAANQSAAHDLRKLAQKIYVEYPEIFKITRSPNAVATELISGTLKSIANINLFAGQVNFEGGKTGYTDEASGNLLSLFSHYGRPVIVIVLGTNDRFGQTEKLMNWFASNYRLAKERAASRE